MMEICVALLICLTFITIRIAFKLDEIENAIRKSRGPEPDLEPDPIEGWDAPHKVKK